MLHEDEATGVVHLARVDLAFAPQHAGCGRRIEFRRERLMEWLNYD